MQKRTWGALGLVVGIAAVIVAAMLWKGEVGLPGWLGGHAADAGSASTVTNADASSLARLALGKASGRVAGAVDGPPSATTNNDTWLGAQSLTPEQVAWYRRNGYPTAEQSARWNHASAALLPLDGVARSPEDVVNAEAVSMMDPVHREAAEAVMRNAAEQGSIYALGALGRTAAATNRPVDAAAYFRLAAMRGDWTMSSLEMLSVIRPLTMGESTSATLRGYQVEQVINQARRARGLPPLSRDLMPGWAEAYQQYYRADSPAPPQGGGGG